jgi:hypothetical protein
MATFIGQKRDNIPAAGKQKLRVLVFGENVDSEDHQVTFENNILIVRVLDLA